MKYALSFDQPSLPDFCEYVVFDGFLPHEADKIRGLWNIDIADRAAVSGEEKDNEELRKSSVVSLKP